METKRIGNIGEAFVLAKLVSLGIPVFLPFGDNESSDLVVEIEGKLCKIQVKTSSSIKKNHTYVVDLRRNKNPWCAAKGKEREKYTDIDYFASYNTFTKNVCIFGSDFLNKGSVTLRINKNTKRKNVNFEEDYLIEKVFGDLAK